MADEDRRQPEPMPLPMDILKGFCQRWKIVELAVFGSAQRGDYGPNSDIDLMVTFAAEARWSLLDHYRMENELTRLLGREVDIYTREAIEKSYNWIRRDEILNSARTIYAA